MSSTKNPLQIATLHWEAANSTTQFPVSEPSGLAFDGSNIRVANLGAKSVTKPQVNDGTVLGAFNVGNLPVGVAFDGTAIWAANSSSGTVTKLEASNGATLGTFTVGKGPTGVVSDGANLFSQSGEPHL